MTIYNNASEVLLAISLANSPNDVLSKNLSHSDK